MKRLLFIVVLAIASTKIAGYAQNSRNDSFKNIAFNYLKESVSGLGEDCSISKTSYAKLPNGNVMVDITVTRNLKIKEELNASPGHYFTQANGIGPVTYSKTAYKISNKELNYSYIVFIRRDGTPTMCERRPFYDKIETWGNHYWFFLDKRSYNLDVDYKVFESVEFRSMDGESIWKETDLIIFSILKTENNVYLAGGKIGYGINSVVRGYDIKTGKIISERNGSKGAYCLSIKEGEEGIECVEYLSSNNTRNKFLIPYEANDKAVHINQILSRYDKSKASDQITIGERYLNGKGFDKDERKAVEWFIKAAEQNNSSGMERVAYCYRNGIGIGMDKEKAVSYYEEAAKLDNKEAINALTQMYSVGDGIPRNMSRALYWQEVLAFKGDIEAQKYILSHKLFEYEKAKITSEDVHQLGKNAYKENNYDWAWFCFERGMSMGNEKSKYNMGLMYMLGKGVGKNYTKAIDYMYDLAEKGDLNAQSNIAYMYGNGDVSSGLNQDYKKMVYWAEKAAVWGNVASQLIMANAYQNGLGVKKSKKKAFEMYRMAAKLDNQDAIKELVYCYGTGKGVKKDDALSLIWFRKLNTKDQYDIAVDFDDNPSVKCTVGIVMDMYKTLAEKKHYDAMKRYAELAVEYGFEQRAIEALNMLENNWNVDYSTKMAYTYMLWGKLYEKLGRLGQARDCYQNSGTSEGKQRAALLNRRL